MTVRGTVALVFLLCICGLTEQRPFFFFHPLHSIVFVVIHKTSHPPVKKPGVHQVNCDALEECERRFLITMIVCLNQTTRKNSRRHSEQHKSNLQQLLIPLTLSLPLSLVLFFSSLSLSPYDSTSPSSCVAITQTSPLKK